jgi:thymidylate synthase
MKQYLELLQQVLDNGVRQSNRTGIDTLTLPGAMLKFDLRDGFPAVTTKKLAFNAVKGELIGFLRGSRSLAEFKALGCNVWDANAAAPAWQNSEHYQGPDDLGRIYGTQWRDWQGVTDHANGSSMFEVGSIDQIAVALDTLRTNPHSRRIIVNAWNAAELDQACLPPCHVLFQLLPHVDSKVLHMTMYQRSCDLFLGVPFNIASYALLLELFAAWSGYTAGTLTMFLADAHIYVNHIEQVKEQLGREPMPLPKLDLHDALPDGQRATMDLEYLLEALHPDAIRLVDYNSHPAIKAPMAV